MEVDYDAICDRSSYSGIFQFCYIQESKKSESRQNLLRWMYFLSIQREMQTQIKFYIKENIIKLRCYSGQQLIIGLYYPYYGVLLAFFLICIYFHKQLKNKKGNRQTL